MSITSTWSPGSPMQRFTRSTRGVSGERKMTMSPRWISRLGRSALPIDDRRRPVDEPVDEEVVADQERVFHRPARDVEGLDREGVGEAEEEAGDDQRLEVLAQHGSGWSRHRRSDRARSERPDAGCRKCSGRSARRATDAASRGRRHGSRRSGRSRQALLRRREVRFARATGRAAARGARVEPARARPRKTRFRSPTPRPPAVLLPKLLSIEAHGRCRHRDWHEP